MSEGYPGIPVENPFTSPETKKDDSKEKKDKKRKGFEALLPQNREKEAQKIREALDKSPLFGESKPSSAETHLHNPEAVDEKSAPAERLGETELPEVGQELAAGLRAELIQEKAGLQDETEVEAVEAAEGFYDKVIAGETIEEAFSESLREQDLSTEQPASETSDAQPELPRDFSDEAVVISREEEGAGTSPVPPTTPPIGGAKGGSGFGGRPATPNMAPKPNVISVEDALYYERVAENRGLLVGGIIGYLIGRRRGRIKTERRLAKVQQKLEKQVQTVQTELLEKEATIRQLVRERVPAGRHHTERLMAKPRLATEAVAAERPESRLGLEKPVRIERLGKAIMQAEAPRPNQPELGGITPERVKTMSRSEVLQLAEKVNVEGASLRQIYGSHLIGEKGLRRLLGEYLQGKDIRKELRREMVEREIDFERDPILRDKAYQEAEASGTSPSLQQLLQKVATSTIPDDALASVVRIGVEAQQEARREQQLRRRVADTAMVTLIVVLATLVTILLLRG